MGLSNPIQLKPSAAKSTWAHPYAASLLLLVLGGWSFANCFGGQFVFDDRIWLDQLAAAPSIWSETFWLQGDEGPHQGRPIVATSFAWNYWLSGEEAGGYHAVNLVLHLLSGLVLFGVLRRTFRLAAFPNAVQDASLPLSFAVSAIWLVHPLQSECINYVSQRTECAVGLTILLALYCAIRSQADTAARLGWMVLAVCSAWFAAGCKELAALIPILVVLYEFAFAEQPLSGVVRARWKFYLGLCSCWLPVATLMSLAPRVNTVGSGEKAGVFKYLLNQCLIIPDYVRLAFWPDSLTVDYGEPVEVTLAEAAPYGLLILAALAIGVVCWRQRPAIAFAIWWFFILLAPTSSVLPIQTEVGAERRMYLPLATLIATVVVLSYCFLLAVAKRLASTSSSKGESGAEEPSVKEPVGNETSGKETSERRTKLRPAWTGLAAIAILVAVITPLSARTRSRNLQYRDVVELWMSAIEARPNNPRAPYNLGVRFARMGQQDVATAAFLATLKIDPTYAVAHNNLGIMLRDQGNYPGAEHHFMKAAEIQKNWTLALHNLARLYATCPDASIRNGEESLHIAQAICRTYPDRVEYLETLAAAYAETGQFEKAVETLQNAKARTLAIRPDLASGFDQQLERYRWELPMRLEGP